MHSYAYMNRQSVDNGVAASVPTSLSTEDAEHLVSSSSTVAEVSTLFSIPSALVSEFPSRSVSFAQTQRDRLRKRSLSPNVEALERREV